MADEASQSDAEADEAVAVSEDLLVFELAPSELDEDAESEPELVFPSPPSFISRERFLVP